MTMNTVQDSAISSTSDIGPTWPALSDDIMEVLHAGDSPDSSEWAMPTVVDFGEFLFIENMPDSSGWWRPLSPLGYDDTVEEILYTGDGPDSSGWVIPRVVDLGDLTSIENMPDSSEWWRPLSPEGYSRPTSPSAWSAVTVPNYVHSESSEDEEEEFEEEIEEIL